MSPANNSCEHISLLGDQITACFKVCVMRQRLAGTRVQDIIPCHVVGHCIYIFAFHIISQ